ncbi:U2 small nuclear ribonucleoprotein auxiliary factor 35 kDa subunit-related protein 2-like [Ylistrum balloti]|uniref:U2 small nuclear ribonucleoprotein auxiliary factor 35 kDa subunit-related protein 2-like n=1 Tax=Ylistrum balloti TaxID=509963 RepID=UPI002905B474|nr:U2 small nuclear ribonucleoprotein auxiliary factor 35 kDa subunit-related protein 2-like [Ylistrum balloti]
MDDEEEKPGNESMKPVVVDDCCSDISNGSKLSHKQWRARLKRERRRQKRQENARVSVAYTENGSLENEVVNEEFEKLKEQRDEAERAYLHAQWLEREKQAQEQWQRRKEKERIEKQRREEQEKKIKEEWEEQQKKEKEEQEKKDKKDKEKKSHQEDLLRQATANENKEGDEQPWHNPIVRVVQGKERDRCPFFAKTAACRFGDRCSRTHPQTESSNTLLFRGMYSHFELEQGLMGEEYDTDLILEYDDSELYQNFREFYEDIVPEFKAIGQVVQVKVCCNYEPHLRGNVYIQYRREDDAASAIVQFNGRYYGGKQLSCEYVTITSWKSAVCGLFGSGRCPKGRNCNFLHVFKNPGNEFWEADRYDRHRQSNMHNRNREWSERSSRNRSRSRERQRSRSKSPVRRNRSRNRGRSKRSRSLSKDRHYDSRRKRSRTYHSRSRSRSKSGDRSKSRRKLSTSRSLSRGRSRSPKSKSRKKHPTSRSKSRDRQGQSRSKRKHSASSSQSRGRSRSPMSRKKHSSSRSLSRERSHSPKSNKKRSFSRSLSRGRGRSPYKSKDGIERKDPTVEDYCVIQSETLLVSESEKNDERQENNTSEQISETNYVKYDLPENSNSSDSEKSTQNHTDKKHKKRKKHKRKKHKVILEWVEAS